jgi:hypothetical protein
MDMNSAYALAAIAAAIGFAVHTFVGSKYVVAPHLAARGTTRVSRWLMFLCWHAVTLSLIALALAFGWAAVASAEARTTIIGLTVLNGAIAALCLYVCLRGGLPPWRIPPMYLFPILTILGLAGLAA